MTNPTPAFFSPTSLPIHSTPFQIPNHCKNVYLPSHPHRRPTRLPPTATTTPPPNSPRPDQIPPSTQLAMSTAASSAPTLNAALADAASRALSDLPSGGPPTLALVFVSVRYTVSNTGRSGRDSINLVVPRLRSLVPELRAVIGCVTDGVVGAGPTRDVVELQDGPALSLTLARVPGINISTFHVMPDDLPSLDASQTAWRSLVGNPKAESDPPAFLVLSDPSFAERGEVDRFLSGMEYAYPGSTVVGSLASAGAAFPDGHMFCTLKRDVLNYEATSLRDSGLVGVSITGDVQVDCLVSPGCRPIGPVFEVRSVGFNGAIEQMELVGRPSSLLSAVGQLKSVISYATPIEKRLIQNDLHIGIAIDQFSTEDQVDNYMIRHVLGVDMEGGSISVGQVVRPGQRIKFFVKERESAQEALDRTMQKYKRAELANSLVGYSNPPFGAFVFVDAGRGRKLFMEPMNETRNLASFASGVPVSGFFGGGQIGPPTSGPEGNNSRSVLHNAANLIALIRRRSGMSPAEPIDSPSTSKADIDDSTNDV